MTISYFTPDGYRYPDRHVVKQRDPSAVDNVIWQILGVLSSR